MGQDVPQNLLNPEPPNGESGCGCGTILFVLLALAASTVLSLYLFEGYLDRSAMRENLQRMGVGRWAHCPSTVDIGYVFTGSASHHYKLWIPPADVDQFLASLRDFEAPPKIVHGEVPAGSYGRESWWRPQDEKELLLVEEHIDDANSPVIWYVAAAKDTGHVYMYKVGH
jgi:hypothetical protein